MKSLVLALAVATEGGSGVVLAQNEPNDAAPPANTSPGYEVARVPAPLHVFCRADRTKSVGAAS